MLSYNLITNRPYTHGNAEKLNQAGGGAWLTFPQLKQAGYRLKKGSHGVQIQKNNGFKYYVFRACDCTLNGEPVTIPAYAEDKTLQMINEPAEEKPAEKAEVKPAETIPEVKTLQAIPEDKPVPADYSWSIENGLLTIVNGKAKGKYSVNGLLNLTQAELKKFIKLWVFDQALNERLADELAAGHYEGKTAKRLILTGKKVKVNADVTKAVKYMTRQKMFCIKKVDEKYLLTDSYMMMECKPEDIIQLTESVPLLAAIKEKQLLDDAVCRKDGKEYTITPKAPDMVRIMDSTDWMNGKPVDFGKSIKDENLYESDGIYAAAKMIDLFKEKLFNSTGAMKPLTKVTDSYRALLLPVRKYA